MFGINAGAVGGMSSPNPMHSANDTNIELGSFSGSPMPKEGKFDNFSNSGGVSKKRRFAPLLVFLAVALVGGGAAAVYLLAFQDNPTAYVNPPPNNGTVPVFPGKASLALCPENQLCHLLYAPPQDASARGRRLADPALADTVVGKALFVARSYAKNHWERSADSDVDLPRLHFDCSSDACTLIIPSLPGTFYLLSRARNRATTPKEQVARFLNQATFGATLAEISSFPASPKLWIQQQMTEPVSSHRAYYREKVNSVSTSVTPAGRPRTPCEDGSRWASFSFMASDIGKELVITTAAAADTLSLSIDGLVRTEVSATDFAGTTGTFTVCLVYERTNALVRIAPACSGAQTNIGNVPITFATPPPTANLAQLQGSDTRLSALTPDVSGNRLFQLNPNVACSAPDVPVIFAQSGGQYYRHSSRVVLLDNSLSAPAITEAGGNGPSICPNVEKSFVNAGSCVIHRGTACQALRPPSVEFPLAAESLRNFYSLADSYVYAVKGLRLNTDTVADSPCRGAYSRWTKTGTSACAAATPLDADTTTTLTSLLADSQDPNPTVRDIRLPNGVVCTATTASVGAQLTVGNECWQHVHADLYNVFDFSFWAEEGVHPGNAVAKNAGRPNPIKKIATANGFELFFPGNHAMQRWTQNRKKLTFIGRLDDQVDFSLLPTSLQTDLMAKELGAEAGSGDASRDYGETCGSPNEVAAQPALGARYLMGLNTFTDVSGGTVEQMLDDRLPRYRTAPSVWTMIGMYGRDQLRQRMAWALSQVLVISVEQLGDSYTEGVLHYYDIFVRHAFGNYRDVLKEVSFSPMMGDYLSYRGSRAFQYQNKEVFPDENYAREIMQLFSIGLYKLNRDGTVKLGIDNKPVESYTNDDISK
jgi:hypothetical protein